MKIPVNLITGFLGVGKTTALLHLLGQRPVDSRWAVLVNEFGQVGIDGATLQQSGVAVREVPGGCICCSAQLPLRVALTKLLRDQKPERVLIEPTGLGHPAGVIDALRGEGLRDALILRNVITLVDPSQLNDDKFNTLDAYRDQLALADVLVANKCDLATTMQLQAFEAYATQCYPPKRIVAQVAQGRLDPVWLEALPLPHYRLPLAPVHDPSQFVARGWRFPLEQIFDVAKLQQFFELWAQQGGIVRAKGVFRTGRNWRLLNLAEGKVTLAPIVYRGESCLDVIARADAVPDWSALELAIQGAADCAFL